MEPVLNLAVTGLRPMPGSIGRGRRRRSQGSRLRPARQFFAFSSLERMSKLPYCAMLIGRMTTTYSFTGTDHSLESFNNTGKSAKDAA